MEEQGVSQSELARRIGVSRQHISAFMSAPGNPTLQTMVRMAHALGLRVKVTLEPAPAPAETEKPLDVEEPVVAPEAGAVRRTDENGKSATDAISRECITMSEVRIGFIGAGGNARGHMTRLGDVEQARIVAICDVSEEAANSAVEEFGGSAWTDHHAMLDKVELDALYISVPPFAHTDAEVLAAQAGLHLFVEKPVVMDIEQGLEILDAIRAAGVLSSVGYQLRLMETSQRINAYLADRTVAMISSHRWGGLPGTPWWRVMDQSGGQLHEQTTHQVDLMRYLTGHEIVEVYAQYDLLAMGDVEGITIPDSQAAMFRFDNGTIATVTTSPMMTQGGGKSDLNFLLRDQIIGWSTSSVTVTGVEAPELAGEARERPDAPAHIDEAFVRAILAGDQSSIPCSYEDGLRTADVTLAANESARTGQPVRPKMA